MIRPCAWLACALLAGCGGTRLQVVDASTGQPVPRARVEALDQDEAGAMRRLATTGGGGDASIAIPEGARLVFVRADGYQTWGRDARSLARQDGTIRVELKPAWLGAFMDGGTRPVATVGGADAPNRCHCHGVR